VESPPEEGLSTHSFEAVFPQGMFNHFLDIKTVLGHRSSRVRVFQTCRILLLFKTFLFGLSSPKKKKIEKISLLTRISHFFVSLWEVFEPFQIFSRTAPT
jgi:hypothetical protein